MTKHPACHGPDGKGCCIPHDCDGKCAWAPWMRGNDGGLTASELYERGELIAAARKEADAAERDGYGITAAMLRDLANIAEGKGARGA